MNTLIQRFPAALLPLLSIKASEAPNSLDGTISPSLDMMPSYLADRLETQSAVVAAISAVTTVSIAVPSGEYWWLWWATAVASNISAPGANVQLSVGIQTPESVGFFPALNSMAAPVVSVAGQQFHLTGVPPSGLLLRPGCTIYAGTEVDPGAQTLDLGIRALVSRLTPNA